MEYDVYITNTFINSVKEWEKEDRKMLCYYDTETSKFKSNEIYEDIDFKSQDDISRVIYHPIIISSESDRNKILDWEDKSNCIFGELWLTLYYNYLEKRKVA